MHRPTRKMLAALLALAALALWAGAPALAIIKIPNSVYALWQSAAVVVEGKVARADASRGEIAVAVAASTPTHRGGAAPVPGSIRLLAAGNADLLARASPGRPVVLFIGPKGGAAVHLDDTWFLAHAAGAGAWKLGGPYAEGTIAYPGRTEALERILAVIKKNPTPPPKFDAMSADQLRAAGLPLRDTFEHSSFSGPPVELGDLGVQGRFLLAADFSADRKMDLVVLTDAGPRFYLGSGPKAPFRDATADWGLQGATACARAAFGDANGDGRPDLLLGALWINTGSKFVLSPAALDLAGRDLLAVALADVTDDKKPDAVALARTGELLIFQNPGVPDAAWPARPPIRLWQGGEPPLDALFGDLGDDGRLCALVIRRDNLVRYALKEGASADDVARLTGWTPQQLAAQNWSKGYFPIADYVASTVIDLSGGDGRPDVVIETGGYKSADMFLLNRGYGAFWFNNEAGLGRKGEPRPVALTAADLYADGSQELLLLDAKGRLWQLDSPPYKGGKPAGP